MFRITRRNNDYIVEHYVRNDPNPSPTARTFVSVTEAWQNALGRAAKMAILTDRPHDVEMQDGRIYRVTVELISA